MFSRNEEKYAQLAKLAEAILERRAYEQRAQRLRELFFKARKKRRSR